MAPKPPAGAPPLRVVAEAQRKRKREEAEWDRWATSYAEQQTGLRTWPAGALPDDQVAAAAAAAAAQEITAEYVMELIISNNMSIEQRQKLVRLLCNSCAGHVVPDEDL